MSSSWARKDSPAQVLRSGRCSTESGSTFNSRLRRLTTISRQALSQQPPLVVQWGHFDQRQGRWRAYRRAGKELWITRLEWQNAPHDVGRRTVPPTQKLTLTMRKLSTVLPQGVVSLHNTPLQSPAQRLQMVDHLTLAAILEQQIRKLSSLIADVFGEQQHRLSQLFQLQLQAVQLTVHRLAGNFHRPHLVDRVHQQLQADHETTAIFQPGQIQTVVCTTTAAQSTIRDHASGTTKQRSRRCRRGVHLHFVLERLQVSGHPRPPSTARTVSHN
ncbi:hypothetical protein T4B_6579 [Trichinella pseudospiralis]|uniref:Uncharacterized protein n=1 Tax=Trichinella pseudospiralis TaxID=6337 RepID=A0A0V1IBW3_TRIPS|nr:hypothetical protein T4A_1818 [Trichinella pseudospiralis]KRZ20294.1 hypothetical protein T4B_6579 [Trichinella pseudospiralis]